MLFFEDWDPDHTTDDGNQAEPLSNTHLPAICLHGSETVQGDSNSISNGAAPSPCHCVYNYMPQSHALSCFYSNLFQDAAIPICSSLYCVHPAT